MFSELCGILCSACFICVVLYDLCVGFLESYFVLWILGIKTFYMWLLLQMYFCGLIYYKIITSIIAVIYIIVILLKSYCALRNNACQCNVCWNNVDL